MSVISKRHIIKIPSEIKVIYCEKSKLLIMQFNNVVKKVIKLKVKIYFLSEKNLIIVTPYLFNNKSSKSKKSYHSLQGTTISLIKKFVRDVFILTCKKLKLVGVGYKVFEEKSENIKLLNFKVGYSHNLYYKIPENVTIKTSQSTKLFVSGCDSDYVSSVASLLKSFKKPEPYKGKGILYKDEVLILKEGKKV